MDDLVPSVVVYKVRLQYCIHIHKLILYMMSFLLSELMELKWMAMLSYLVLGFLMLGGGGWCEGCLEEERLALFRLKPFFPFIDSTFGRPRGLDYFYYPGGEDYDSVEEKESWLDCCKWERVECNPTTGRLTHLFLNVTDMGWYDAAYNKKSWYLNTSLFLPFQELQYLSLSGNLIAGCVAHQGFERLSSKLNKLEILDLSFNYFSDSILTSISELSSLKSLSLNNNQLTLLNPTNGIKMLSKLNNLETLDLSYNNLGNNILSQLHDFISLKSLNLQDCGLEGTINLLEFNTLTNLKELYLDSNGIEGIESSFQELRLKNLKVLHLNHNPLDNSILVILGRLSNLKILSLGITQLNESIDITEIDSLKNLEELKMSCYSDKGCNISLQSLNLFSSLKTLYLDGFNIEETKIHSHSQNKWQNLTNLEELMLSDSYLPFNFIGTLVSLKQLSMDDCYLDDRFFKQDTFKLKKLETLRVSRTFFGNNFLKRIGAMPSLKILSLDYHGLNDTLREEFDGLNSLNLEELDISCYSGGCSLPLQSFGPFPSLKTLSLDGFSLIETTAASNFQNKCQNLEELVLFDSSLPFNFIGTLSSLKQLSMYWCYFNDNLSMQDTFNLKNLESLSVYETYLGNNFFKKIGAMPFLKILNLRGCGMNGTLHSRGFCGLTNLRKLYIRSNNLKGNLPECVSNFTSLESLDLFSNQFSGDISTLKTLTFLENLDLSFNQFSGDVFALKALTSLQVLRLSNNYFEIPSSLGPFFNLSQLKYFRADNNTIYAESEIQSSVPRFQLNEIRLSCCGDAGQIPPFLYSQHDLRDVDLSNLNLEGEFPNWLLQNNTNLETLNLSNNSLRGPFELPFPPHTDLSYLDISKNSIDGKVPIEIGERLPSLSYLNMARNHFHGSIPASIGDMNSLGDLNLSDNQLSGGLPEHLSMGCSSLVSLTLSNNSLQGQIPSSWSNCSYLTTLDVSNNELSGEIPRSMGSMSSLKEVLMARNHLEGPFPKEFCHLNNLKLLDLSVNNISGHIPSCFSPFWINQVHLSKNKLQGPLTNAFRNSTILVTLDLSNNHLTGKIPNWIGNLSQLSFLLLNNNRFEGRIPIQLCNLNHLSLIDLSKNNLSGTIPSCLKITTWNEIYEEYARYVADIDMANIPFSSVAQAPTSTFALSPSSFSTDELIEFTTKNISYTYKGKVLTYLSGIDLSCNKLTGEIPHEVENFRNIFALNLSHNSLLGPIPLAFSDLKQIESLDLSHNDLSGTIPPQLVELYRLSYFSVAYNNLSGSTPVFTAQFATFEESSYVGNPLLCGQPLPKNCSTPRPSPSSLTKGSTDKGLIDMTTFYASFVASYVVVILSIASVLYINPYWRRVWFYHVGEISKCCYYFLEDHILPKRFHCGN